jgi:iron complex outermembrane receptor protein
MDEEYYVQHFNAFLPIAVFGEPRTYGVEIAFEY